MIPDPDLMTDTLVGVMELLTRGGWDQNPGLFALRTAFTDQVVPEHGPVPQIDIAVEEFRVPQNVWGSRPGHNLAKLAANLAYNPDFPSTTVLFPGLDETLAGIAWHCEGWQRIETPAGRAALGDTDFADVPGSREVRMLTAVDTAGRGYHLSHLRGEPARPVTRFGWDGAVEYGDPNGNREIGGGVAPGLLLLLLAMARQLPSGSHTLPPLPELPLADMRRLNVRRTIDLAFTGANP